MSDCQKQCNKFPHFGLGQISRTSTVTAGVKGLFVGSKPKPPFGDTCKVHQTPIIFKSPSPEACEMALFSFFPLAILSQGVRIHAHSTSMSETFTIQLHLLFRRVKVEATNLLTGLKLFKPPHRSSPSTRGIWPYTVNSTCQILCTFPVKSYWFH